MKKELIDTCNYFASLIGKTFVAKTAHKCGGKWRGTTDYSLLFSDGTTFYISNGMKFFEKTLKEKIDKIVCFKNNKTNILATLKQNSIKDNERAKIEGLLSYTVLDVEMSVDRGFLWAHLLLDIDRMAFKFMESELCYAIFGNEVKQLFERRGMVETWTAGAVVNPTYIFANVRFSHLDDLYKVQN